ncbi:MAG: hypothetical protein ABIE84_02980 [bacterium]
MASLPPVDRRNRIPVGARSDLVKIPIEQLTKLFRVRLATGVRPSNFQHELLDAIALSLVKDHGDKGLVVATLASIIRTKIWEEMSDTRPTTPARIFEHLTGTNEATDPRQQLIIEPQADLLSRFREAGVPCGRGSVTRLKLNALSRQYDEFGCQGADIMTYSSLQMTYYQLLAEGKKAELGGDKKEALYFYHAAILFCPDQMQGYFLVANLLNWQGQAGEAGNYLKLFSLFTFHDSLDSRQLDYLGLDLAEKRLFQFAVIAFSKAIEATFEPVLIATIYTHMGMAYKFAGELDRAEFAYRQALIYATSDVDVWLSAFVGIRPLLLNKEDFEMLASIVETGRAAFPSSPEIKNLRVKSSASNV